MTARLVVINDHAYINGGAAKVAIDSAIGFARRGVRVDFFAAVGPVEPGLIEAGVDITLLAQSDVLSASSLTRFGAQWLWNVTAARRLSALLAGCDPEQTIVHLHGWAKALSPAIGPALMRARLPVVETLHEYYLACPNGGFYDHGAGRDCGRMAMSPRCVLHNCDSRGYPRKVMRVGRHALMRHASGLTSLARHVVTLSKLQRAAMAPYLPGAVFHEISNPIDVADPGPPDGAGATDFLFVGRLSAEKGPRYFGEAARLAGVTPVFVGDGPERAALEKEFPQARFLGWLPPAGVRDALRRARALVFPSVWYEGQPLTIHEALAQGVPVIVSDLCAGRETVADGETGFWFDCGDARSLAARIELLKDDELARRLSLAAHARYWAEPLTLDRHLDAIAAVHAAARADWDALQ
ncbi:glycosyltransferase family 4 protein [Methylocystis sp. IM3]|uniref:glycosyltransferase family 4 protein n=1 Tax=unclassified Methylocystis TaxID=2625913 RepID=UPI0030FA1C34